MSNNEYSQPLTFQRPDGNQLEPVLTSQEENELDQENNIDSLLNLYTGEDQDTSGVIHNSQGSTDTDQIDTDMLPEVLQQINPENRDLEETRAA